MLNSHTTPLLSIVVPCYNEEEVLKETFTQLSSILKKMIIEKKVSDKSFILFVDDGSHDKTWKIIENEASNSSTIQGLKLSRNVGHQNALVAGMQYVTDTCDALISIDADLQDDVNAIFIMVDEFLKGNDIVYGVRSKRDKDTLFKKFSAETFYTVMKLMGVNLIFNHADYRLLSKKALNNLNAFPESNLFLRGIIPTIGLPHSIVYYERDERFAGESKYPLRKMLSFAWDGVTSFSSTPLRFISILGFLISLLSISMSVYIFYIVIFTDKALPGWASTVLPIYFIGGIQILSIGVAGEYIGKIYKETKRRPLYFIEEATEHAKS